MRRCNQAWAVAVVALTVLASAGNALAVCYWLECETGGHKDASITYVESTGTGWAHTSAHSGVAVDTVNFPGVAMTAGIGSRYTTNLAATGTFTFTPIESGEYEVFATWGATTNGDTDVTYTLSYEGGTYVQHFNQYQGNGNSAWNQIGGAGTRYTFNAGVAYTLVAANPTHEGTAGTGTRLMCDAVVFRKFGAGCGDVPAVAVKTPVLVGDTVVTVQGVDPTATAVRVYANGSPIGTNNAPGGATVVNVNTSALVAGTHINATQTLNGNEGCPLQNGPIPGDCAQIGSVAIGGVLIAGDTSVPVSGVDAQATAVKVYKNGTLVGTKNAPGGASLVTVTVAPALANGDVVAAIQEVRGLAPCTVPPADGVIVGDCAQVGAVSVAGLVDAGRTAVRVTGVSANATTVKVYTNDGVADALIGTSNAPTSPTTVVTVPGLVLGQSIKAVQTIRMDGCMPTTGRRVMAAGVIEDFEDTPVIVGNPSITGGANRTWYNVNDVGYCVTVATASTLFGSQCLRVEDNGWTNGEYAVYEQIIPAAGEYHLQAEMLVDEVGCGDPDWLNEYQVGLIVNGIHRGPAGTIVACSTAGSYTGALTSAVDGTTETQAITVLSDTFTANAGDSLLIAVSTNATTYSRSKANTSPLSAMKIDNLKLNVGPRPCRREDVPAVVITKGPLEHGGTQVIVSGIDPTATLATVYEYTPPSTWVALGSAALAGSAEATVTLDADKKLVAGKTIVATQTMLVCSPSESKEGLPPAVGPVVGTGQNTVLRLAVGIRETGGTGPIGADGGTTGPIEWIGAAKAVSGAPQGALISPAPEWQTITFSSTRSGGTDPVLNFNAGNSVLDGAYGVLEHLALTIAEPAYNTGRYVLYIDNVSNGATTFADFEGLTADTPALFRNPNVSITTAGNLLDAPIVSTVDATHGDGAGQSLRVEFQFKDQQPNRWVRLTTDGTGVTPALPYRNPLVDLSQPITMRVLFFACHEPFADADGDGDVDMIDFALFQTCFTGPTTASEAPGCACFSVPNWNGATFTPADNDVDTDDFAEFLKCMTGPGVPFVPAEHPDCAQW